MKNYKIVSFFNKIFLLSRYKYYFSIPNKKYFCIYDDNNTFLQNYFNQKTEFIKHNKINIFILFLLLFKNGINIKEFMLNYLIEYIKYVQAKIFISNIDNNILFWRIKKFIPDIKIIIIQNGWRLKKYDIFEKINKKNEYKSDLFFTFNNYISIKYSNYINSKFITIGSLENNYRKVTKFKNSRTVLFLSEYIGNEKSPFFIDNKINFNSWYNPELNLLVFLKKYCLENNYTFKVSPRTNKFKEEYAFYKNILGNNHWEFLDKNKTSSYHEIDKAKIAIAISSTIGYEALARGKKVIFFACRKTRKESGNFGWPAIKKNKGLFWTNNLDIYEFKKILDRILCMNDASWNFQSKKIINKLINYDKNNSIFKKEISAIIH
ncbi:Surface carbohydrate biosynthesis protein, Leptospira [Candidatus Pelagibacterales bacterium]